MSEMDVLSIVSAAESAAIQDAAANIDRYRFNYLAELLATLEGKLVTTGVGKSALVARKLSATFATVGVSAFFLDCVGLFHGELGALTKNDFILMVSCSGETSELLRLLPSIPRGCSVWSLVGTSDSTLGRLPTSLCTGCSNDPIIKVPSASSAAAVAVGDSLAIAVAVKKGFGDINLRDIHPGGSIGSQLRSLD